MAKKFAFCAQTMLLASGAKSFAMKSLGERVKEFREAQVPPWNQTQMARAVGTSRQNIANLEDRGVSQPSYIRALARVMGTTVDDLLTGTVREDSPYPPATSSTNERMDVREPAHSLILQTTDDPSRLNWRTLLDGEIPERFSVQVPDDAMAPRVASGTWVRFMRTDAARPGDGVLVRDADRNLFFRVMRERKPGHWLAVAENPAYEPLDSIKDQLTVLGVLIGVDQRWG